MYYKVLATFTGVSSLSDDLLAQIKNDLMKTGFASEMMVAQYFLDQGWHCTPGKMYFDLDERISRELDLAARKSLHDEKGNEVEFYLSIEVKKSNKPWVVFRHRNLLPRSVELLANPSVRYRVQFPKMVWNGLREYSLPEMSGWIGYGIHEAFRDAEATSRWYSAAVTACKAAFHERSSELYSDGALGSLIGDLSYLLFTYPIVVLDGNLVSAHIDKEGDVQIEAIPFAPMQFEFKTANYDNDLYRVDIVTLSNLEKYIGILESRLNVSKESLAKSLQV